MIGLRRAGRRCRRLLFRLPLPLFLRPPGRAFSQQLFGLLACLVIGNARLAAIHPLAADAVASRIKGVWSSRFRAARAPVDWRVSVPLPNTRDVLSILDGRSNNPRVFPDPLGFDKIGYAHGPRIDGLRVVIYPTIILLPTSISSGLEGWS